MKDTSSEHSHSVVKLTTLEHQNVLLTQKLKQAQDRYCNMITVKAVKIRMVKNIAVILESAHDFQ